jgi:hypothetical protein
MRVVGVARTVDQIDDYGTVNLSKGILTSPNQFVEKAAT